MRRKAIMVVLLLGAVGGYAVGFAQVGCWKQRRAAMRQAFEQRVAKVCVDAARDGRPGGRGHDARAW